jgi:predicted PurR-regulated permease PerM
VAIAEKGLGAGLLMLLVVLLVTTIGGVLGGLVGLMMAVPTTVIGARAVRYVRAAFEVDGRSRPSRFTDRIVDRGDHVRT